MKPNVPSFDHGLSAINYQEPDHVPSAELWVDPEVKQAFLGRLVDTINDDVAFWVAVGYDFITLNTDLYAAPQILESIVAPHKNTANAYEQRREARNWVSESSVVIRDRAAVRPLLFHSDGLMDPVISDIAAAGVDALHPIGPK